MLVSCFLGTTIEWYDFLVYGFLAPLAFGPLFFPSLNPTSGTIARGRRGRAGGWANGQAAGKGRGG